MTLLAPARVTVVPVAASAALRPLLAEPAEGSLLGVGERLAWARVAGEVLVIGLPGGVRMPNGVEAPLGLPGGLAAGDHFLAGDGGLVLGDQEWRAVRWWNPRPVLPRVDPAAVRVHIATVRGRFAPAADEGLGAALAAADAAGVLAAAGGLIGKGPGLTPLGDDVLTGAVAGSWLLGEAVNNQALLHLLTGVIPGICALARERTTALAATLLRHGCRGEVDDASAALLLALCGRGDPEAALDALLALGHSSGTGLATGLLAGAVAAGGVP
jgi:hypothetical protein